MAALESERARRQRQVGVKVISLDEMWIYVGVRRGVARNSRPIWTAVVEERDGSSWIDFEMGDRSEATFCACWSGCHTERYRNGAYGVYGCLPVNKRKVGKDGAVNGNEGQLSVLRGKLNRLVRRTKAAQRALRCR